MKSISSNSSVSSISSYKSNTSSHISSQKSTMSTLSEKTISLKSSVKAMKRIKGHLSKKIKKGFSSSATPNERMRGCDTSLIEEEDITLDFDTSSIIGKARSSSHGSSTIHEDHNEDNITYMIEEGNLFGFEVANVKEVSDLTPRARDNIIEPGSLLSKEKKDSMEKTTIEFPIIFPPSKNSFEDDTASLASFQTVETVERLIHNPTTGLIFLLLLQLKTKKFEIIQFPLPANNCISLTIGDILKDIPLTATDSILAQQQYRGICRPSDGIEMVNLSTSAAAEDGECRIFPGEVLVPIPAHHCGYECMCASQHILNLPGIEELFQRLNSLKPLSSIDVIHTKDFRIRSEKLENNTPPGCKLKHVEDYAVPSDAEVKSLDTSEKSKAFTFEKKLIDAEDNNEYVVEVFKPDKSFPNMDDLMDYPIRTLRIYEKNLMSFAQKQIFKNSPQYARLYAHVIVKLPKILFIFFFVRKIIVGTLSITVMSANMKTAASSDPLGIAGLVEFVVFLSLLMWYQKRRIQRKLLRSSEPRKINLFSELNATIV